MPKIAPKALTQAGLTQWECGEVRCPGSSCLWHLILDGRRDVQVPLAAEGPQSPTPAPQQPSVSSHVTGSDHSEALTWDMGLPWPSSLLVPVTELTRLLQQLGSNMT